MKKRKFQGAAADTLLRGVGRPAHVGIGPIVSDEVGELYFVTWTAASPADFFSTRVGSEDLEGARKALMTSLAAEPGVTVHDFDSEYRAIRMAAELFPCPKTEGIRDAMRREDMDPFTRHAAEAGFHVIHAGDLSPFTSAELGKAA